MLHPCVALDMLSVGENRGHFWFYNYTLGGLIHAAGTWCCIHVWRWICSVLVKTGDTWFDNYMLGGLIHAAGIWCCIHVWRWICSVLVKTGETFGLITTRLVV